MSGIQFGKYTLLANIATGGMAEVVLARMHGAAGFQKLVVLKRLLERLARDPQFVQMFLDEAKIAARLSHSNIVQVLELGQTEGRYFITMEFLSGMNLATLSRKAALRAGRLEQDLAAALLAQACAGLHYAHERRLPDGRPLGLIHRDVSPQNLIVTYEGLLKIVDFGIAKAVDRGTTTRTGHIKGKFAYMSPEQCRGDPIDRRSDIFSLGIVMWELLTQQRLFRRDSTYLSFEAILQAEIPRPSSLFPDVDPEYERIALKALERDLERRYATAEAMQDDLEEHLHRRAAQGLSLLQTRVDIAKYLEVEFGDFIEGQRDLLARLARGEITEAPPEEVYPSLDPGEDEDAPTRIFHQAPAALAETVAQERAAALAPGPAPVVAPGRRAAEPVAAAAMPARPASEAIAAAPAQRRTAPAAEARPLAGRRPSEPAARPAPALRGPEPADSGLETIRQAPPGLEARAPAPLARPQPVPPPAAPPEPADSGPDTVRQPKIADSDAHTLRKPGRPQPGTAADGAAAVAGQAPRGRAGRSQWAIMTDRIQERGVLPYWWVWLLLLVAAAAAAWYIVDRF